MSCTSSSIFLFFLSFSPFPFLFVCSKTAVQLLFFGLFSLSRFGLCLHTTNALNTIIKSSLSLSLSLSLSEEEEEEVKEEEELKKKRKREKKEEEKKEEKMEEEKMKRAKEMVQFLNDSWTPYHAVLSSAKILLANGFQEISEKDRFMDSELKPTGKYFYTRGLSSIVAFAIGGEYEPGNGFVMIGAHTDSPCPKLKPKTKVGVNSQTDLMQVAVQPYGGGLWHTWFDRDLGVAGRVVLMDEKSGKVEHRLVKIEEPMLRVPNLAIHLNRDIYTEGFKVNFQTHMAPLLGLKTQKTKKKQGGDGDDTDLSLIHI